MFVLIINIALFLLVFLIAGAIFIPQLLSAGKSKGENRCKIYLRHLGTCELDFIEKDEKNNYGTFVELQQLGFIDKKYTRDNYIEKYDIVTFNVADNIWIEERKEGKDSTFTIVAIPDNPKNKLRTFAIGDHQMILVWTGDDSEFDKNKIDLNNQKQWESLR